MVERAATLAVFAFAALECGVSEEQKQALDAAVAQVGPAIAKFEAIANVLPDNAKAKPLPCVAEVPLETTVELSYPMLTY